MWYCCGCVKPCHHIFFLFKNIPHIHDLILILNLNNPFQNHTKIKIIHNKNNKILAAGGGTATLVLLVGGSEGVTVEGVATLGLFGGWRWGGAVEGVATLGLFGGW